MIPSCYESKDGGNCFPRPRHKGVTLGFLGANSLQTALLARLYNTLEKYSKILNFFETPTVADQEIHVSVGYYARRFCYLYSIHVVHCTYVRTVNIGVFFKV